MTNSKNVIKAKYKATANIEGAAFDKAVSIINNAEKIASNTILNNRQEVARRLIKLRNRCKKLGFKHGNLASITNQANQLSKQLHATEAYISSIKEDCFITALSVVKEVLQEEMTTSADSLHKRLQQALASITDRQGIRIFVNPRDHEKLLNKYPEYKDIILENKKIIIGNAIINTAIGRIEISWEEHLNLIKDMIFSNLNIKDN